MQTSNFFGKLNFPNKPVCMMLCAVNDFKTKSVYTENEYRVEESSLNGDRTLFYFSDFLFNLLCTAKTKFCLGNF